MKFSDILGHEREIAHIRSLIDNNHMPHALLLHGAEGIGKLAVARAVAQYIHCEHHTADGDSCGVCPSCRQHQAFNHPDLMFSFPIAEKGTSGDFQQLFTEYLSENDYECYSDWQQMQKNTNAQLQMYALESDAILHKMTLSAYSAAYKVMIMWLPEKMNIACANKLLKIIEEPFDDTIMLFVSDTPKEILPTIFSRTQRLEIKRNPDSIVAQYLMQHHGINSQDALAIASTTEGNVNKALEAIQRDSESHEFFKMFVEIMRKSYQRDFAAIKEWSEKISEYKREKARRFIQYSVRLIRENFIYNLSCPSLVHLTGEEENFSVKFAQFINERNVEELVNEFNKAETDIRGNGNSKIVLFDLALKITKLIRK